MCRTGEPERLSTVEPACYSTPEESGLRVETLPFERVPHQTRLFLDYLNDPVALRRFSPAAVRYHHELPQRIPEVLAAQRVDRQRVADALERSEEHTSELQSRFGISYAVFCLIKK